MTSRASEPFERNYHHGDLKRALLDAALDLLRRDGPDAMTLRAVARAAGVSQAAPYRHFTDRRALVAALAEEGFARLGEAMREPMQADGGAQGFRQVAVAYVRFAHEHPAEYRVMFGAELADKSDLPSLRERSRGVLDGVVRAIVALQEQGIIGAGNAESLAVAIWSMLHGLVMLSLDGQTAERGLSLDALVNDVTRVMMNGMKR